jgi:hypothetical protein
MASATRTTDHEAIRRWVEERGGIPAIVKGTEGLLRIDFVRGEKSGGRAASLEEVDWERWFEIFDDSELAFLCSPDPDNKFFKLVRDGGKGEARPGKAGTAGTADRPARAAPRDEAPEGGWTHVLVEKGDEGWLVALDEGAKEERFATKAEAVRHARELARAHPPAELVIEDSEGEEQDRIRYGSPDGDRPGAA